MRSCSCLDFVQDGNHNSSFIPPYPRVYIHHNIGALVFEHPFLFFTWLSPLYMCIASLQQFIAGVDIVIWCKL